jgi:hypothetical protein
MPVRDLGKGTRELKPKPPSSWGFADGVLFDYGRTLVTFAYPTEELLSVLRDFRPRIQAALGVPAPQAETMLDGVLLPMEEYVRSTHEDEVDYIEVYRDSWQRAGWRLPDDLLRDILDAE